MNSIFSIPMLNDNDSTNVFYLKLISGTFIGGLILGLAFWLYAVSYQWFGDQVISAVSSFGAAASSVMTVVLLIIYLRQTKILESHQTELAEQSELMGLSHTPEIVVREYEFNFDGSIDLVLENRGEGYAAAMELITRIETPPEADFRNSLSGNSDIYQLNEDGNRLDTHGLAPNTSGTFRLRPVVEETLSDGGSNQSSLREIVRQIKNANANSVQIEMEIQPYMQNGEKTKPVSVFNAEPRFSVDLTMINTDTDNPFQLQNLRQWSKKI